MKFVSLNGEFIKTGKPIWLADNRSYRYGDGLFETMKLEKGRITLENYHWERLNEGLRLLNIKTPRRWNVDKLREEIIQLCRKNKCEKLARLRLSVSRGNGGLYDATKKFQWLLECWPLTKSVNHLNENGWVIDIYPDARKSYDLFSHLKSANFLPYVMAADYAREHNLNDCLVLNTNDRIADSTIANIFIIRKNQVITPPLRESCIYGVMRRKILETKFEIEGLPESFSELPLTENDLEQADEVFLTNSIHGLRWVQRFRDKEYGNELTTKIFNTISQTIS